MEKNHYIYIKGQIVSECLFLPPKEFDKVRHLIILNIPFDHSLGARAEFFQISSVVKKDILKLTDL